MYGDSLYFQIPVSGIQNKESENMSVDQGKDVEDNKPLSKIGELNCLASDTVDDLDYASDVSSDILQPTQVGHYSFVLCCSFASFLFHYPRSKYIHFCNNDKEKNIC